MVFPPALYCNVKIMFSKAKTRFLLQLSDIITILQSRNPQVKVAMCLYMYVCV
jgi:hypothetical protein